jgi:hypothetical protein
MVIVFNINPKRLWQSCSRKNEGKPHFTKFVFCSKMTTRRPQNVVNSSLALILPPCIHINEVMSREFVFQSQNENMTFLVQYFFGELKIERNPF